MESSFDQPAGSALCPTCGNPVDSRATICAACGTPLAVPTPPPEPESPQMPRAGEAPEVEGVQAQPMFVPALLGSATAGSAADAITPAPTMPVSPDRKRCDWCGAENPLAAERCVRCNAMFPRPEQDEAMRRAGAARIQAVEDEIALRQRARKRSGLGRIFGS
jgi:ribosomal protein L40E